jgi:protein lifeguard
MYGGMGNDVEDPLAGSGFEFSDKTIRQGFIRKVYGILMVQLLVTFGLIAIFVFHAPTREFAQKNRWLTFVAMGITFVTMIAIACCGEVIYIPKAHSTIFFWKINHLLEKLLRKF